mgnify:CR=1 FL=1
MDLEFTVNKNYWTVSNKQFDKQEKSKQLEELVKNWNASGKSWEQCIWSANMKVVPFE